MSRPRPARTTIRHGMPSCARYGCTREECRRAYRISHARTEMDRARGITGRVEADQAARRVQLLLRAGMSTADIASTAGVSRDCISRLARGVSPRIMRITQDAVLGVPIPQKPMRPQARGYIDAIGAQRRLRALATLGWTRPAIAERTGLSARTVGDIRRGDQSSIFIDHHQEIIRVYDELWNRRPEDHGVKANTASRLRAYAARRGWPRPADLDDDLIDWRTGAAA